MFMNIKLAAAVLTVVGVVYLTVPIVNHPIWTSADGVANANGEYGVLADFSIVDRYDTSNGGATFNHKITDITHGHCDDLADISFTKTSNDFKKKCKAAKVAHTGLVLTYVLYLGTAFYHSHSSADKRNKHPFWIHMLFLLASWSLLVTLAASHAPITMNKQGGGTVDTKWNPFTLTVLITAIVLQATDLLMSIYSFYKGEDYAPAFFSNGMHYASAM